ncbi:MAG: VanZ family protein [Burkholderiaceae bacterium]
MADIDIAPATRSTKRILRALFALTALLIMVLSLLPLGPEAPSLGWDKANHMTAFALLALLGCRAYPAHVPAVLVGLLAYGGLIEILQSFTSYRTGEWADLFADALGLPLGWVVARLRRGLRGDT